MVGATRATHLLNKRIECCYFAALSREPLACTGATGFGGGQVASRLSSATASPSLDNLALRAARRPSDVCDVSVNSNCGSSVSACTVALVMRRDQLSNPDRLTGNLKYCAFDTPFEIATVGNTDEVVAGRWEARWNTAGGVKKKRPPHQREGFSPPPPLGGARPP